MGRGRDDTCENCVYLKQDRDRIYRCGRDEEEIESGEERSKWCRYHRSEDE